MIDGKKLIEDFEKFTFTDENQKKQYRDLLNYLINNQPKTDCSECSRRKFYQQGYQDGLNADKWIPCEVEMPKEHDGCYSELIRRGFKGCFYDQCSDEVLVTYESRRGREIKRAKTFDGKWNIEWEKKEVGYNKIKEVRTDVKVLAWQPLPQLYKKEGAENEL